MTQIGVFNVAETHTHTHTLLRTLLRKMGQSRCVQGPAAISLADYSEQRGPRYRDPVNPAGRQENAERAASLFEKVTK